MITKDVGTMDWLSPLPSKNGCGVDVVKVGKTVPGVGGVDSPESSVSIDYYLI